MQSQAVKITLWGQSDYTVREKADVIPVWAVGILRMKSPFLGLV